MDYSVFTSATLAGNNDTRGGRLPDTRGQRPSPSETNKAESLLEGAKDTGSKSVPGVSIKASGMVECSGVVTTTTSNDVEASNNNSEEGELSNGDDEGEQRRR